MQALQEQIGTTRRVQWMLLGGTLLIAAVFAGVGYMPTHRKLAGLNEEIARRQAELLGRQDKAARLRDLERKIEIQKRELGGFDEKLPKQQDLGQFIKDLTQMGQQSLLRRSEVKLGVPRRMDLFSELLLELTFEGDFNNVYYFVRQTEEMKRLTRVRNLRVRSVDSKQGQVEVHLALSIYFLEGQ